jgi:uncharacterized damage-inducible protein DinB
MFRPTHFVLGAIVVTALATSSIAAQAPYSPDRATALEMRKEFLTELDSLHSKFMQLAEAFPADKYAWRPAPGVRSVGEVFMHVASEYYYWTPAVFGAVPSSAVEANKAGFEKFEKMSSKPEVLKHLQEGFAYGRQAVAALDEAKITGIHKIFKRDTQVIEESIDMMGDLNEHLGQLIAYARMNGVKPPWSK